MNYWNEVFLIKVTVFWKGKYLSSFPPKKLASDWLTELVDQSEVQFLARKSLNNICLSCPFQKAVTLVWVWEAKFKSKLQETDFQRNYQSPIYIFSILWVELSFPYLRIREFHLLILEYVLLSQCKDFHWCCT